jgi:hypothetical protein
MANVNQIGQRATTIQTDDDGMTRITYHSTDVVKFNDQKVILNTGGWQTQTTVRRMNQASNQFKLGYKVFQRNFNLFVTDRLGCTLEFMNGKVTVYRI